MTVGSSYHYERASKLGPMKLSSFKGIIFSSNPKQANPREVPSDSFVFVTMFDRWTILKGINYKKQATKYIILQSNE